jgi:hypothetical protein
MESFQIDPIHSNEKEAIPMQLKANVTTAYALGEYLP